MSIPNAPTNLRVNWTRSGGLHNVVTWNGSGSETGFNIYRAVDGDILTNQFTILATVTAPVTTYNDPAVSLSHVYGYRITAFNADGESPLSGIYVNHPGQP